MDPQNTIILILGTPNMVPLILGNPQVLGEFFMVRCQRELCQRTGLAPTHCTLYYLLLSMLQLYRGYIGIMEKKMETYRGYMGGFPKLGVPLKGIIVGVI